MVSYVVERYSQKTGVPLLSCAHSTNSGAEALILALPGPGDAAFVAGGGRNAVVVWTSGGATYRLSWNTLSTAGPTATTDPVVALAKTIASRV